MDPYEKIREQLERAQQRGVDALTNRLNFISESLSKLVEEARGAISEAAPADPEELLPVGELAGLIEEARTHQSQAEERAADLARRVEELEAAVAAAKAEAEKPAGLSLELLRRLDAARSQSELLKELLPLLLSHAGRAAVLVIRDGTVSAWSGIGFSDLNDLKSWQAEVSASEVFERFVSAGGVVSFTPGSDPIFSKWLERHALPVEAWLIPVNLRGRIVGAMYIDRIEDRPWDPEGAQGLVALACLMIDTLGFRTVVPSPVLTEPLAVGEPAVEAETGGFEETPATGYPPVEAVAPETPAMPAEETEETAEAAEGSGMEPTGIHQVVAERPVEEEHEAPVEEPTAAVETYEESAGEAPAAEETVPPEEAPGAATFEEAGEVTSSESPEPVAESTPAAGWGQTQQAAPEAEVSIPPEVQPVVPPSAETAQAEALGEPAGELSEEERAAHEEAKRFARLLVSEIKLYNPEEVERGKEAMDLYQRLKEDIDRSREMYDSRISEAVRASHDYFREELIRILADGDEEALGM